MKLSKKLLKRALPLGSVILIAILGFQNCGGGVKYGAANSSSVSNNADGGNGEGYSGLQGDTYYRVAANFQTSGPVQLQINGELQATPSGGYNYIAADGSVKALSASDVSVPQGTSGVLMYNDGLYYLSKDPPNLSNPGVRVSLGLCVPMFAASGNYSADIGVYSNGILTLRLIQGQALSPIFSSSLANAPVLFESTATRLGTSPNLEFSSTGLDIKITSGILGVFDGIMQFSLSGSSQNENVLCTLDKSLQ